MPNMNDYHAFKNSSGDGRNSGGNNGGFGCGWIVIVIVAIMLVSFLIDGAGWEAIETLLSFGIIAFLLAKYMF